MATDLASGREVWLREGSVIDAVRASIALPGLFTPALQRGVCWSMADWSTPCPCHCAAPWAPTSSITVDLNWELVARRRRPVKDVQAAAALAQSGMMEALLARFRPAEPAGAAQHALFIGRDERQPQHHAGAHHAKPPGR